MLGGSPPFFSPFLSFFLSSFFLSSNQTMLSLAQFSNFRGSQIGPLIRFNSHSIRRYVIFRSFFILITRFPITPPRGELNLRRFISRDQYLIESPRIESRRWRKKIPRLDKSWKMMDILTLWLRIRNERKRGFTITRKERRKLATSKKRQKRPSLRQGRIYEYSRRNLPRVRISDDYINIPRFGKRTRMQSPRDNQRSPPRSVSWIALATFLFFFPLLSLS